MKTQVLPFTCLKHHFSGEIFEPVENGGMYQLESLNFVLVGSNGNAYQFKTFENAMIWIDSNLIRASKQQVTQQAHIDALIYKNSLTPHDYIANEIEVLLAKNAGDWIINDEILDGGNAIN